eukprot:contig_15845_g3799
MIFPQVFAVHFQMPAAVRLTLFFPQKEQVYVIRCAISMFLACFRSDAPYRVPYLPIRPALRVRLPMVTGGGWGEAEWR